MLGLVRVYHLHLGNLSSKISHPIVVFRLRGFTSLRYDLGTRHLSFSSARSHKAIVRVRGRVIFLPNSRVK